VEYAALRYFSDMARSDRAISTSEKQTLSALVRDWQLLAQSSRWIEQRSQALASQQWRRHSNIKSGVEPV
jgi:hypothetical protein